MTVEGELGVLAGVEDEVAAEESHYTKPEEVVDFVTKTGVDSLAISIGTSHGAYKFTPEQCTVDPKTGRLVPPPPGIRRARSHREGASGLPIVLHGSSSVPQEEVDTINKYGGALEGCRRYSRGGVAPGCQERCLQDQHRLRLASCHDGRHPRGLRHEPAEFDPRKYLGPARDNMKKLYIHKIKEVLGSDGKAE